MFIEKRHGHNDSGTPKAIAWIAERVSVLCGQTIAGVDQSIIENCPVRIFRWWIIEKRDKRESTVNYKQSREIFLES